MDNQEQKQKQEQEQKSAELKVIETWDEWLALWNKSRTFEEYYGLLDFGLTGSGLKPYSENQITSQGICFYLDVADGHQNIQDDSMKGYKKKKLAQKAYEVLYRDFFSNKHIRCVEYFFDREVFEKLLWFLLGGQDGKNCSNFLFHQGQEAVNGFLEKFFYFALMFPCVQEKNGCTPREWERIKEETGEVLSQNQPKIVELMALTGHLEMLLRDYGRPKGYGENNYGEKLIVLSEESEDVLLKMSLVKNSKITYKNLNEALLDGSKEAQTLLIYRAMKLAKTKQVEVKAAENALAEAQERLKRARQKDITSII